MDHAGECPPGSGDSGLMTHHCALVLLCAVHIVCSAVGCSSFAVCLLWASSWVASQGQANWLKDHSDLDLDKWSCLFCFHREQLQVLAPLEFNAEIPWRPRPCGSRRAPHSLSQLACLCSLSRGSLLWREEVAALRSVLICSD